MLAPTSNGPPSIIWEKGMMLGPGAPHDRNFADRIGMSERKSGSGTIEDPVIIWAHPNPAKWRKEEKLRAIEDVVRQTTTECGLSYAWLASDAHPTTTVSWNDNKRVTCPDDYHVTLRMGSGPDTCNLHGHIYLIYENHDITKNVTRAMTTEERSIPNGFNPQLLIWGRYPSESPGWPRSQLQLPVSLEIKKGSILEFQNTQKEKLPRFREHLRY